VPTIFTDNGPLNLHREGAKSLLWALQFSFCFAAPTLETIDIHLFQNDYQPLCDDEVADYEEADFQDYAAISKAIAGACSVSGFEFGVDGAGRGLLVMDQKTWTMGVPGTTNLIYGVYITADYGDDGVILLASRRFTDGPFAMTEEDDAIKIMAELAFECQMVPLDIVES